MSALARAVAFFERCEDAFLLHELATQIAPRAKRMVGRALAGGGEAAIPEPAGVPASPDPASEGEARDLLERTRDFAELQALAQAIGRRIEALEIAASADFGVGTRIEVRKRAEFPPRGDWVAGTVTATGTTLRVTLQSGKRWHGSPSLARLPQTQ